MRYCSAYELDIWYFVHLDVEWKRKEYPDWWTDNHGKEEEDQFETVASPAQTTSPQLIQVRLDLQ